MSTIKASREIDKIFQTASRAAHPLLIVLAARTPEGRGLEGRVAFIAGKKLGHAVLRNRCRRVMRAMVRRAGGPWPGWDVVIIARQDTAIARPGALDGALVGLLTRLKVVA